MSCNTVQKRSKEEITAVEEGADFQWVGYTSGDPSMRFKPLQRLWCDWIHAETSKAKSLCLAPGAEFMVPNTGGLSRPSWGRVRYPEQAFTTGQLRSSQALCKR
ncbi:uncharacterized protein FN964_001681 [Alca torda]